MTVGEKIKLKRQEKGMTQDELAYKCNVSRQTIYKWENDLALPETNNLPTLVSLLGLTYEELLGHPDSASFVNIEDDKSKDSHYIVSNVEYGLKKHWQKISYILTISGFSMIFLGIIEKLIISIMFKTTSDTINSFGSSSNSIMDGNSAFSGIDTSAGKDLIDSSISQMNSMSAGVEKIMSIIGTAVICLGIVSALAGIAGIIYDRVKMKKYRTE